MFRTLLLIALVPAFVYGTLNVNNCGSNDNFPISVEIQGCHAAPCALTRGSVGITHITIKAPHDILALTPSVKAKVGLFTVNYVLPDDVQKGCNWLLHGHSCPIKAGTEIVYELRQEVDPASPTLFSPVLTFNLHDHNNVNLFCWSWTANIVA